MRLIGLLILGAGAAYAYKRFTEERGGYEATAEAQPFSSEQLGGDDLPVESGPEDAGPEPDPLTRPSWLSPADAG